MPRLLHIVLNDYANDNRVRRAAECGRDLGFDVTVFAMSGPGLPSDGVESGVAIRRFNLVSRPWSKSKPVQVVKYLELYARMLVAGIRLRPDVIHANDADGLPIGGSIAAVTHARLLYDAHELWADPTRNQHTPRWLAKLQASGEWFFARRADACITVSDSIAGALAERIGLEPVVVRNVPERWSTAVERKLRKAANIPDGRTVVLFQGVVTGESPLLLARAFRKIRGDVALVFLGSGPAVEVIRAELADLSDRVHFLPFVPKEELPAYTSDADIGVHALAGGLLNHMWALPNKLFEYIQGHLALVVSDLPEMARVVAEHGVGLTCRPGDVDSLAEKLQLVVSDRALRERFRSASARAAEQMNWDVERLKLERLYRGDFRSRRS
ncbi:MAG: glycosyltransferase family 4 protein [Deltaproteobacteria bacterium]|nr:glycosyltransferase family 4 protein [Deltaproteobacteria bacterium]